MVLVGAITKKRKHVDWEIYAGLRGSINGNAGLIGVLLPSFPISFYEENNYANYPARLADNVKSGYAEIYNWNSFIHNFDIIIQEAFDNRITRRSKINNSRTQMQRNL